VIRQLLTFVFGLLGVLIGVCVIAVLIVGFLAQRSFLTKEENWSKIPPLDKDDGDTK